MNAPRTCLVVEADPLSRFALCSLLSDCFEVDALDCREAAIDMVRDIGGFEVLLLDMRRREARRGDEPSGLEAIRAIRKQEPATGIVARGGHPSRHAANEALRAGALTYISRKADPEHVRSAVINAAEQETYVDPSIQTSGGRGILTKRQREILQLFSEGRSVAYAARTLSLSEETVKTHLKHIHARLGARNRPHAVAIALRDGLIE